MHIAQELLAIESRFVENMRLLLDSFIRPLAAQLKDEEENSTREGMAFSK